MQSEKNLCNKYNLPQDEINHQNLETDNSNDKNNNKSNKYYKEIINKGQIN